MNPITFHFAAGDSLYTGVAILFVVALGMRGLRNRWLVRLRNLLGWVSMAAIALSSAPVAWTAYAIFAAAFLWWFLEHNFRLAGPRRTRTLSAFAACLAALLLAILDVPYRRTPALPPLGAGHLYVLGDSLSSGIDTHHAPWPTRFAAATGLTVTNLSRAGFTTGEAIPLAEKVEQPDSITVVELGGNDLLSDTSAADFRAALDRLLTALAPRTRAIVMFELPLTPGAHRYGRAQRQLAAKHGIYLVPKRRLVDALAASGSLDGLHLGDAGADEMVRITAPLLAPAMQPAPPRTR